MFINYDDCILNYIASIRKYYGLESSYQENENLSSLLNDKKFNQVILILIDAMGSRMIKRHLSEDSFIRKHMKTETTTVFPPTTTAATTAILNGKSPNETCWLGWLTYDEELKDEIIPFLSSGYYSQKKYDNNYYGKKFPTYNIIDELNSKNIPATAIFPSFHPEYGVENIDEFAQKIVLESKQKENKFIYAYWDEYDSCMHKYGVGARESIDLLTRIDEKMDYIFKHLAEDTLVMVIADHGQVDVYEKDLAETNLPKYFKRNPDIEPRAVNFHIKDNFLEEFRREFIKQFEDDYILLSKQEVLDTKLFGKTKNHEKFENILGDYLAIAKKSMTFKLNAQQVFKFKGAHAGCNIDELMIPIIYFYK